MFSSNLTSKLTHSTYLQGLAFMWQRKAGLITSWTWGTGFVIAHLGPGRWSAPLFLKDRFASVGLTAGFRTVDTFYAIPCDTGMEPFTNDYVASALDVAVTLEYDPFEGNAPLAVRLPNRCPPGLPLPSETPKAYSITDGVIVDFSWRIGAHLVDDDINEALYGSCVTPEQILEGKVQIPHEFLPLYSTLAEVRSINSYSI